MDGFRLWFLHVWINPHESRACPACLHLIPYTVIANFSFGSALLHRWVWQTNNCWIRREPSTLLPAVIKSCCAFQTTQIPATVDHYSALIHIIFQTLWKEKKHTVILKRDNLNIYHHYFTQIGHRLTSLSFLRWYRLTDQVGPEARNWDLLQTKSSDLRTPLNGCGWLLWGHVKDKRPAVECQQLQAGQED